MAWNVEVENKNSAKYQRYFQRCTYKETEDSPWTFGIAAVAAFDCSDVEWIIDGYGNKVKKIWDYRLTVPSGHCQSIYIDLTN